MLSVRVSVIPDREIWRRWEFPHAMGHKPAVSVLSSLFGLQLLSCEVFYLTVSHVISTKDDLCNLSCLFCFGLLKSSVDRRQTVVTSLCVQLMVRSVFRPTESAPASDTHCVSCVSLISEFLIATLQLL